MRQIWLITRQEYIKYITRRGFIISLLLFPFWIAVAATVPALLQKTAPAHMFVVIDHDGGYRAAVQQAIERRNAGATLQSLADFAKKEGLDLARLRKAAPELADMLESPKRDTSLSTFQANGGLDSVFDAITPYLRPGWRSFSAPRPPFVLVDTPDDLASARDLPKELALYFKGERGIPDHGRLYAALVIPSGFDAGRGAVPAQYWSGSPEDSALPNFLRPVLSSELRLRTVVGLAPGSDLAPAMRLAADLDVRDPTRTSAADPLAVVVSRLVPLALAFLLFFASFTNATALLTGVIEEKSTRMIEILMTCASAREIMTGKLLGAIGASLTTILCWAVGLGAIALALAPADVIQAVAGALHQFLRLESLPFLTIYFTCGLLIYGSIYLGIGSMAASIADAQAMLGPASLIIFVPNMLIGAIMADPNGMLARIVSWIPIYTPFYMLMRMPAHPAPWEIWATTALTVATTVYLLLRMSKVFANHVLTTERPPPFGSLVRKLVRRSKAGPAGV